MDISLSQLAQLLDGELDGDGDIRVAGAATIRDARDNEITLAEDAHYLGALCRSKAAAAVVPRDFPGWERPLIRVADIHAAFAKVVTYFRPACPAEFAGVHVTAQVHPTARIGPETVVHAGAWIGARVEIGPRCVIHPGVRLLDGCRLGEDVTVFPNAVLYDGTIVGNRCLIHANAVLGAYGFGYSTAQGRHCRSSQLGYVELGDDVEIGACTTVDRGTYGATIVGEGTKVDNQVMIAHNCRIGRHNLICSQVGIAGSVVTGDYVVMAGQVGVRDHVEIGDAAVLGAQAGVVSDLAGGKTYLGAPAIPERDKKYEVASMAKLPALRKQLKQLQRQVEALAADDPRGADREAA